MITTLLLKEIRHHRRTTIITVVLSVAMLSTLVTYFVLRDTSSLLQIGAVAARLLAPVYAVLAARRLFVLERREGTWDFLAALPVSPAVIVIVKMVVGALFTVGLSVGYLLALALLLRRRELIPTPWLLMMSLQVAVYALAWFGIAALFAQLGRHRIVAWGMLLVLAGVLLDYDELLLRDLTWLDAVWLPIDHTRFAPPTAAVIRAALWGFGTLAIAVLIARVQDGLLVQRWYRPMTGRQRSMAIAWIVGLSMALTVLMTDVKKTPRYDPLPLVGRIRVAASVGAPLYQLATELDAELTALQEPLDIDTWPAIVILREREWRPDRVVDARTIGQTIELYVNPEASPRAMLRESLRKLLVARTGFLSQADEPQAWIGNGFAEAWLRRRDKTSEVFDRRAAWAGRHGVTAAELQNWWDYDLRVGQEVADAVAWVGLEVVAAEAGEAKMMALARAALGGWQPRNGIGLARRRLDAGPSAITDITELDWDTFLERWLAELKRRGQSGASTTVEGRAIRVSTSSAAVALAWTRTTTQAEQLWYTNMPALSSIANPAGSYEYQDLDDNEGILSVEHDERARIVVTFARYVDGLDAWIIDGWREVEPE